MSESNDALGVDHLLEHQPSMQRLARQLVRDEATAEDVVQDTWIRVLNHSSRWPRAVRSWLESVVRSVASHEGRARTRRRRREAHASRPEAISSTHELAEKVDVQRALAAAVLGLNEPYRSTLLWRYFEDRTPTEIAKARGIPVSTVKTQLQRGHAALRQELERCWGPGAKKLRHGLWLLAGVRGDPRTLTKKTEPMGVETVASVAGVSGLWKILGFLAACALVGAPFALSFKEEHSTAGKDPQSAPLNLARSNNPAHAVPPISRTSPDGSAAALDPVLSESTAGPELETVEIHGTVVDEEGVAIHGAKVWIYRMYPEEVVLGSGHSDKDGTFRVPIQAPEPDDSYSAFARHPNFSWGPSVSTNDLDESLSVTLAPRTQVQGRVLDAAGLPLAGVEVSPRSMEAPITRDGPTRLAAIPFKTIRQLTGTNGEFVFFDFPAGRTLNMRCDKAGYAPIFPQVSLSRTATSQPQQWEMFAEAIVRGRVFHEDGVTPAEGVDLWCDGADTATMWRVYLSRGATTLADGSYELRGLPHGKLRLSLLRDESIDRTFSHPKEVTLVPGQKLNEVDFFLKRGGGTITLSLFDEESGEPIAGARVTCSRGGFGPSRSLTADEQGVVTFDALPGDHYIHPWGLEGYLIGNPRFLVVPMGNQDMELEYPISPAASLKGRIVYSQGLPVAGADVRRVSPEGRTVTVGSRTVSEYELQHSLSCNQVLTDVHGQFELSGFVPGHPAYVRAWTSELGVPHALEVELGSPAKVTLHPKPSHRIIGRVTNERGESVGGAKVRLLEIKEDGEPFQQYQLMHWQKVTTDSEGHFEFQTVWPEQRYRVAASKHSLEKFTARGDPQTLVGESEQFVVKAELTELPPIRVGLQRLPPYSTRD